MRQQLDECECGSSKPALARFDGHGIFLTYRCDKCWPGIKRKRYRADIHQRYPTDEQIEEL